MSTEDNVILALSSGAFIPILLILHHSENTNSI